MQRWAFNFAFFFAVIFWCGFGILSGFYGAEIGILLLGKTSMTSKFMRRKDARRLKQSIQSNALLFGAIIATLLAYFMWNNSWQRRWLVQGGTNFLFFLTVMGLTYNLFKTKYMSSSHNTVPPPPYTEREH
jgi:hypothetical protein